MSQTSRLQKKLEICFEKKEYYEAHQIYRTLFYRLSSSGHFDELLVLLEKGCLRLIDVNEIGSAYDLAEVFSECLQKGAVPITTQRLDSIVEIFSRLPSRMTNDQSVADGKDRRTKFIANCVKWSQEVSTRPSHCARGIPSLHSRFAHILWNEKSMEMSRAHFMLSDEPEKFASFLVDWHTNTSVEVDADMWITQAILQLICLRRIRFSLRLLSSFTCSHPSLRFTSPPFPSPLINFSWMLLHTLPTKNIAVLGALLSKYQNELQRDPSYMTYLDQIGQLYFGVAPKQQGGGLFGSLIKGLMGGESEKDKKIASSDSEEETVEEDMKEKDMFNRELSLLMRADEKEMQQDDDLD